MIRRFLGVAILALCACKSSREQPSSSSASSSTAPAPAGTVTVTVVYGSEKKTWLEEQVKSFAESRPRTKAGAAIEVKTKAMGSGEALRAVVDGKLQPTVFSPASTAYLTLLNDAWVEKSGRGKPLAQGGEPLVLSPVVVAMWRPMAEALGWPQKRLGWSDLLAVNANPKGWGALKHPEWGTFKLGHTHPEFSNSGLLAVLAEAYAGAGKTRGLSAADLEADAPRKMISAVEQTIVHYGKSTGFFADKMLERGPAYLSAAVLYENLVIESYARSPSTPLVAIYPREGTFWSDHPYAILDAEWVKPEEKEAAEALLAFLRARPAQERALALGFRPGDPAVPIGAPVDAEHGVDARQPETLLEIPDGATLAKLVDLWKQNKKTTDVVLVFDKSGSMTGVPLAQAKQGAKTFLGTLHDSDEVTLLLFDHRVAEPLGPLPLGANREKLLFAIDAIEAKGGTALHDAVAQAFRLARERTAKEAGRIHAIVVMTDGKDEHSKMAYDTLTELVGQGGDVKLFTIAYGSGGAASRDALMRLAEAAGGAHQDGGVENIVTVFEEMAAFL